MKESHENTLCLVMIVKDEEKVIEECLSSVSPFIDYWIICDTGSSDNTPNLVKDFFDRKGIPGELHHYKWQDGGGKKERISFNSFFPGNLI